MEQELVIAFKKNGYSVSSESVQHKLGDLIKSLDKTAQWGAQHYEIFLSSREYSREVTLELAEAFEEHARQESRKQRKTRISFADQNVAPDNAMAQIPGSAKKIKTPSKQAQAPLKPAIKLTPVPSPSSAPTPGSSFQLRNNKGKVVSCFNPDMKIDRQGRTPAEEIAIRAIGEAISPSQNFMVDRLANKVAFLENRILDFARAVEADKKISLEHSVNAPSQEDVWVVGRVCCEDDSRMTEGSVMLEGSIAYSQGNRVHLDVSRLESYSIFPGQILAVRGVNASGDTFSARQIISAAPMPPSEDTEGRSPLSMIVAAGPFSLTNSLRCEPLEELLEYCSHAKPDVLLLLGPFVDSENPLIRDGQADQIHQDLFEEWVIGRLMSKSSDTLAVLLPSVRDVHHLPLFPQPALQVEATENIVFLDNPAVFSCQHSTFGVLTSDVLLPLSAGELKRGNPPDRLASLAANIVQQGSFFPIFPPPLGSCLDTTLAGHLKLRAVPDVLILPSNLNSFAKVLPMSSPEDPQCLCINPGRLTRGQSGGTFAHVQISASSMKEAIDKCCKVEIRQL